MVVQIKEPNQVIAFSIKLDLEPQDLFTFQSLTHTQLRTSTCLPLNKTHHKLRRHLW
jgi:hypothetical protein